MQTCSSLFNKLRTDKDGLRLSIYSYSTASTSLRCGPRAVPRASRSPNLVTRRFRYIPLCKSQNIYSSVGFPGYPAIPASSSEICSCDFWCFSSQPTTSVRALNEKVHVYRANNWKSDGAIFNLAGILQYIIMEPILWRSICLASSV